MPHGQNDEERAVVTDEDLLEQEQAPKRENAPQIDTNFVAPIEEVEGAAMPSGQATGDAGARQDAGTGRST